MKHFGLATLLGAAGWISEGQAQDAHPQRATAISTPSQPPALMLTGIAAIGDLKFVYLLDPVTSQSIELSSGVPSASGIDLLKVLDVGLMAGWKVLIRQNGSERWLNFAPSSQLASAGAVAILSSANTTSPQAPLKDLKRPPPQNAGTMSNETPSAAVSKRPLNSFPLPGGL